MQIGEATYEAVETKDRETGIMGLLSHPLPFPVQHPNEGGDILVTSLDGGTGEVLPPYASYSSWVRLLEALAHAVPPFLDEFHLSSLNFAPSSSMKPLRSALRFFGLIRPDNRPSEKLEQLVEALRQGGGAKVETLRELVYRSYHFIFSPDFDLQSASASKLRLHFGRMGARGQIQQKCCSFFLNLARDAGVGLPPQLLSRSPVAISGSRQKTISASQDTSEPQDLELNASLSRELAFLRDLFPMFDIDWPDEKKQRWFRDFTTLMKFWGRDEEYRAG